MDDYIKFIEEKLGFKLDNDKSKIAYINGYLNELQFMYEQSGLDLPDSEIHRLEKELKEKLGLI